MLKFRKPEGPRAPLLAAWQHIPKHVEDVHLVFNGADASEEERLTGIDNGWYFITNAFAEGRLTDWLRSCAKLRELRLVMPKAHFASWRVHLQHVM